MKYLADTPKVRYFIPEVYTETVQDRLGRSFSVNGGDYSTKLDFLNFTSRPIIVCDRRGLSCELPKHDPAGIKGDDIRNELVILVTIRVTPSARFDPRNLLTSDLTLTDEMTVAKDSRLGKSSRHRNYNGMCQYEYRIPENLIYEKGGTLYLENIDTVISINTSDLDQFPFHPQSIYGKTLDEANNEYTGNKGRFGMSVKIVDNAKRFGSKYININGCVYFIPATIDEEKNDGVYLSYSGLAEDGISIPKSQVEHFTFDTFTNNDADPPIKLYDEYRDAASRGDYDKELERRQKAVEREFKLREQDYKERILELETEAQISKRRYDKEKADADINALHQKSEINRSSDIRKALLDILKWVPAIIGAIVTIASALSGRSK